MGAVMQVDSDNVRRWLRGQHQQWDILLSELIDNGFGANAKRVDIAFTGNSITVQDDGDGCPDLMKMLIPGERIKRNTDSVGHYGIGCKEALMTLGDRISITSRCGRLERDITLNWNTVKEFKPTESETNLRSGTKIVIAHLVRKMFHPDKMRAKLSVRYMPAIAMEGRQIIFDGDPIAPFMLPAFVERDQAILSFPGNREAEITIGLYGERDKETRNGMMLIRGFRVMEEKTRLGLGDKPTPRLLGLCVLKGEWDIYKNKTSIAEEQTLELGAAIQLRFADIINKAAQSGVSVLLSNTVQPLNDILNHLWNQQQPDKGKIKRDPPKERKPRKPTVEEIEAKDVSGITIRKAHKITPASKGIVESILEKNPGKFTLYLKRMGSEGGLWENDGNIVYLNQDIPCIGENAGDMQRLQEYAAFAIATWLWNGHREKVEQFSFMDDAGDEAHSIALLTGYLLSHLPMSEAAKRTA